MFWLVVKRLEQGKEFEFHFPFKYFVISLLFSLIITLYGIYPHNLVVEYVGNNPREYFRLKDKIEEPVYRVVGFTLLINLMFGLWYLIRSKPDNKNWIIIAIVLTFQISGLASTYTMDRTLITGLGD